MKSDYIGFNKEKREMKKAVFYTITLIIPVLLLLSFSAWAVPGLINYQGKLTDPNGISLDGLYIMKFYLYDPESGGSPLWNEQQEIMVTNGIYNVELGITPFPSDLFDNENLYLEVEIFSTGIGWETLSPRQRLTSTPFAMRAASSNIAGDADTVDGIHAADLEESNEIDADIAAHMAIPDAHHTKTTSFAELSDMAIDEQIPDDITVNYAATAGDADKLDGKDSSEFGDGHSLDAADGSATDVMYVDNAGNIGIGTSNPQVPLHVRWTKGVSVAPDILVERRSNMYGSPRIGFVDTCIGNVDSAPVWAIDNWEDRFRIFRYPDINSIGKEFLTVLNNGNVGIGTTDPTAVAPKSILTVEGDGRYGQITAITHYDFDPCGVLKVFGSRGSQENPIPLRNGDRFGLILAHGYTGGADSNVPYHHSASIEFKVDGLVDENNLPSEIQFFTRAYGEANRSARMVIDSNGNVGIGTTNPGSKLHLEGAIAYNDRVFQLTDSTATGGFLGIEDGSIITGDFIPMIHGKGVGKGIPDRIGLHLLGEPGEDGSNDAAVQIQGRLNDVALTDSPVLRILNYTTELMRIAASGNVGIGTENPDAGLQIAYSDTTRAALAASQNGSGDLVNFALNNDYDYQSKFIIKNSGNVGIGTTDPQQKMHISGVMRLEPQSSPPTGALGDLYVGTDGKLYFHNGTQWKEVSLI